MRVELMRHAISDFSAGEFSPAVQVPTPRAGMFTPIDRTLKFQGLRIWVAGFGPAGNYRLTNGCDIRMGAGEESLKPMKWSTTWQQPVTVWIADDPSVLVWVEGLSRWDMLQCRAVCNGTNQYGWKRTGWSTVGPLVGFAIPSAALDKTENLTLDFAVASPRVFEFPLRPSEVQSEINPDVRP